MPSASKPQTRFQVSRVTSSSGRRQELTWETGDLADLVDDENDAGGGALAVEPEGVLVGLHGVDGAHQRAVEAVHGGHQVPDRHDQVQAQHVGRQQVRLLLGDGGRQGHRGGLDLADLAAGLLVRDRGLGLFCVAGHGGEALARGLASKGCGRPVDR